jgi:O-antigen/teichoic acid export membrane protein
MRRTTGPLLVLRLVGQGAEFVAIVVLARRLGPGQFGVFSVGYLICRYLGLLADWGASISGTRDVAAGRGGAADLVRWRQAITAVAVAAFAGGAVVAGHGELALLSLTIAARGASRDWIALGRGHGLRSGLPSAVQGVLLAAGSFVVGTTGGAARLFAGAAVVAVVFSVGMNRLESSATRFRPRPGWYLAVLLADQVCATADVVLISLLRSEHDAGIYAAVYRFPNAWITVQGLVIAGVLPWLTTTLARDPERVAVVRRRALGIGGRLALGAVALMPIAWAICPIVFGEAYRSGRSALLVLLAATAVSSLGAPVQALYFAVGDDRSLATWGVLTALVNVGANLVVIPHWGLVGAATVTLASQSMVAAFVIASTAEAARQRGSRIASSS